MKKRTSVTTMMMGMCMWTCCMCMAFCAFLSDLFSISRATNAAA